MQFLAKNKGYVTRSTAAAAAVAELPSRGVKTEEDSTYTAAAVEQNASDSGNEMEEEEISNHKTEIEGTSPEPADLQGLEAATSTKSDHNDSIAATISSRLALKKVQAELQEWLEHLSTDQSTPQQQEPSFSAAPSKSTANAISLLVELYGNHDCSEVRLHQLVSVLLGGPSTKLVLGLLHIIWRQNCHLESSTNPPMDPSEYVFRWIVHETMDHEDLHEIMKDVGNCWECEIQHNFLALKHRTPQTWRSAGKVDSHSAAFRNGKQARDRARAEQQARQHHFGEAESSRAGSQQTGMSSVPTGDGLNGMMYDVLRENEAGNAKKKMKMSEED